MTTQISNRVNIKILLILLLITIALGITFFFRDGSTRPSSTGDSSALIVGQNAIYVAEQPPSRTVSVAVVRLVKPGFVVIYEVNDGQPRKILGTSGVLPAGETKNLTPITLSRATTDGETLSAMLYIDDGDGTLDESRDQLPLDSLDEPVMMIFSISLDASEPGAISL